jgi:small subunit ribosomal protein S4
MKRQRKKYQKPLKPWDKERIQAERKLIERYGLKNKRELWRMQAILRAWRSQARRLLASRGRQAELETRQLLSKLRRYGLVGENATLDDVLGLTLENVLERRLQTIVWRKGLARSARHARQLIVHGKVVLGGQRVNSPSFLIEKGMENLIEVRD